MCFLAEGMQQPGAKEPVCVSVHHGKPELLQQCAPPDLNSVRKRVRSRRTRLMDEDTGWWMRTGAKVENKTSGWQGKDWKGKLGIRAESQCGKETRI